ncbi:hypothetical protein [Nostoc sp.]
MDTLLVKKSLCGKACIFYYVFCLPSYQAQIFPLFPLYIIWGLSVGFSEAIAILYAQK